MALAFRARHSRGADCEHAFDAQGGLAACVTELVRFRDQPLESLEVGALIRHCGQALCAGALPARRLDPGVTRVLHQIQRSDDLRLSLAAVPANKVGG